MRRLSHLALLFTSLISPCLAQQFDFPEAAVSDRAALQKTMPGLARQVLAVYKDADRATFLDNQFRLQLVSGQYAEAFSTIAALREAFRAATPPRGSWVNAQFEIYARAKILQSTENLPFNHAYSRAFREAFAHLDDRTSALVIRNITMTDSADAQRTLERDLNKQKGQTSIELAAALRLVRDYQIADAYAADSLNQSLIAEDDLRRYVVEKDIQVKTPDGAIVCALINRPRGQPERLPTLLKFTIYVDPNDNPNDARLTAASGYVGVVGFTRGKACSPDKPVPYIYDGSDSAALIDWISHQPWSDGRVGMFGGSYEGFTQFAAAKYMPKALKAIMPGVPAAPAIDVPAEGNVFWNFVYPWPFYTTNAKGPDDATYNNYQRWQKLNHDWYTSGRAYRDLDKIDGTPNPIFDEWLAHPDYDAYWQHMIPYEKEFARITIPVLVTAGYFYGGPGAAVYYVSQLEKYAPKSEHYLLIGPYDHPGGQFGVVGLDGHLFDTLGGMRLDPVAQIDITELRYQWFDYIFKGGPRPDLLKDRVNFQVTGANQWKHRPSLAAMSDQKLRFYLSKAAHDAPSLTAQKNPGADFVALKVDFSDRSDVDRNVPGGGVVDTAVDTWNGVEFVSDPLPAIADMSGLFSGHLDFVCNRKDFDFEIDLYELTPKGEYVQLTEYWTRASYINDRSHRRLLTPGRRERFDFQGNRLMSRQPQQGSRLVMVLTVIKEPGRQINYGTGKDVSDETIHDAKEPLQVRWFNASYLEIPVWK